MSGRFPVERVNATFEELAEQVREIRMTPWQKRSQAIDWVVGNLRFDRAYTEEQVWELLLLAAKAYDARNP